jgi:HPt (histidine-containing phosphotransfer) domain-containing protein
MPNMDGYALAHYIRSRERGGQYLPIIALTANAMQNVAASCRAAGMDDFLTKPVQLAQLKAMLEKWLPAARQEDMPVTPPDAAAATVSPMAILDTAVLAQLVGANAALIAAFLRDYRDAAQQAALELHAALARQDWPTLAAVAHRLKSSSRAVGALALGECCARLEEAGKAGDGDASTASMSDFDTIVAAVIDAIEHHRGGSHGV